MERTWPLRQQYAWLVVGVVGSIVSSFSSPLVDAVGVFTTVAIYAVVGVVLGAVWYALNPRPLGERARAVGRLVRIYLIWWTLVAAVLLVAVLLDGGIGDTTWSSPDPGVAALPGLPLGLWLTERLTARTVTRRPVLR